MYLNDSENLQHMIENDLLPTELLNHPIEFNKNYFYSIWVLPAVGFYSLL